MLLSKKNFNAINVFLLLIYSTLTNSAFIEFEPSNPITGEVIRYRVSSTTCPDIIVNNLLIDANNKTINIASSGALNDFGSCLAPNKDFILGSVSTGLYTVNVYKFDPNIALFSPELLTLTTQLNVIENPLPDVFQHEAPLSGSIQSGIGLIRGWVCAASRIEVFIDQIGFFSVAYGTSREDTRLHCDDANNGYGMVINWGLLGTGQHNLKIIVDGFMVIADVDFEVVSLNTAFETGLEKQFELQDFPDIGEAVILKWIEADQNFKIIQHNQ